MTKTEKLIHAARWLFNRHDARHDQVSLSQYVSSVLLASPDVQQLVLTRYRDELEEEAALREASWKFGNAIGIETVDDVVRYLADRIPNFAERYRVTIEDGRFVVSRTWTVPAIGISIRKVNE